MEKLNPQSTTGATDFVLPANPEHRELLRRITERDRATVKACENRKDYRYLLNYSFDETEDFLRATSRDSNYSRYSSQQSYKSGGWL